MFRNIPVYTKYILRNIVYTSVFSGILLYIPRKSSAYILLRQCHEIVTYVFFISKTSCWLDQGFPRSISNFLFFVQCFKVEQVSQSVSWSEEFQSGTFLKNESLGALSLPTASFTRKDCPFKIMVVVQAIKIVQNCIYLYLFKNFNKFQLIFNNFIFFILGMVNYSVMRITRRNLYPNVPNVRTTSHQ